MFFIFSWQKKWNKNVFAKPLKCDFRGEGGRISKKIPGTKWMFHRNTKMIFHFHFLESEIENFLEFLGPEQSRDKIVPEIDNKRTGKAWWNSLLQVRTRRIKWRFSVRISKLVKTPDMDLGIFFNYRTFPEKPLNYQDLEEGGRGPPPPYPMISMNFLNYQYEVHIRNR